MSRHLETTVDLVDRDRELLAACDERSLDDSTVIGSRDKAVLNGELVVAKSATVLPISEEDRKRRIAALRGRVRREHRISEKLFAKSVWAARSAGEALIELKDLAGHGEWGRLKKDLQDKLQVADTTLSLYMRIYDHWDRILEAIQSRQLQDVSLRRVAKWLSQTTSNAGKDNSRRSLTLIQPASLHRICEDRDLAGVISQIEAQGFTYHSTNVACEKGGSHLFLVTGVRGGAIAATDELGTWIEVADREEAISQMTDRLAVVWPEAVLEIM